ncbi:protein FAM117B-like [Eriocheir sinensis]|uniref:protein FAM117B-like n=1 Tax=Eriocheir sinensis TaxID=95602 RepID=UPI0021C5F94A|nr:protein FAM117B-like [Eriocheir sinensis]
MLVETSGGGGGGGGGGSDRGGGGGDRGGGGLGGEGKGTNGVSVGGGKVGGGGGGGNGGGGLKTSNGSKTSMGVTGKSGGGGGGLMGGGRKSPLAAIAAAAASSCSPPQPATPAKSSLENQLMYTPPHVLIRSISSLSQHSLRPVTPESDQEDGLVSVPALRKGVLLQARDRLFSRWKERYFVLTRDYLACFRRGSTKYSEMGSFIFKVNLACVECVEWQDRRGGPALALSLPREGRVLLRAKSGLDQWYRLLLEATNASRHRRNVLRRGTSTTHLNHTNNNLDTTPPPKSSGIQYSLSGSTPEIARLCDTVCEDSPGGTNSRLLTRHHRFSLLADPDLGSCDTDVATPPSSVTSSNKFSTSTSASNTSGSGGSSSLASSPSLRGSCAWPRPSSPVRPLLGDAPRSRLSLYEGVREMPTSAKTRHSMCLESQEQTQDATRKQKNRHSICIEPRDLARTRASLCMEPRNPLLELMESVEAIPSLIPHDAVPMSSSARTSPSKSEGDRSSNEVPVTRCEVDTSPCPGAAPPRPRAHSTSLTPERSLGPRSRSNLGFFRHSGLFNNH